MANGGLIGSLRVTLGLDSAQFEAGTKRARSIAKRDATAIQQELSKIRAGFNGLVTAGVTTALVAAGKRALDYASSLGEVAQQAGVTATELQEYRYAASQAGITSDEMDKALGKLTKTMGEALAGEKSQVAAFRELGVALQDANGRIYSAGELFPKLADAFAKIENPAKRARLQTDLFGKSGQKLDTLLSGGSKALDELRDAAHRLGIVLSDQQIQNADKTADRLAELKQVLEARIAGTVADNADAIAQLANALFQLAGAAVQVSAKLPGALTIAAGAAVGGRVAGGPGALVGGLAGMTYELYSRQGDPYGVRGMSNDDLAKRARALAGEMRGGRNDQSAFAVADAIQKEFARRRAGSKPKRPTSPIVPEGALPVASGGGGKKSSGKGRDRTAEYLERFNREMESLADEQLRLTIDQTTSLDERAQLEARRIKTELDAYKIEIESRRKAGELDDAQEKRLVKAREKIAADEQAIMWDRINGEKQEHLNQLLQMDLDSRQDALQIELDQARTQEDRRRIGLRLLDLDYEREKAALEHVKAMLALNQATQEEAAAAERRLEIFEAQRKDRERAVRRDTMGPLERYIDDLPKNANELNEAYQAVATDGLQSLNDGLAEAILQSKSLGDVFKNVANQIIGDLARIAVQQMITKPLAQAIFGGGGGLFSGLGRIFGGGGGLADFHGYEFNGLPGLATGGSFMVGGRAGTDRNVLAINGIPRVRVSSDERINVQRAGQDNERPLVIQIVGEESSAFLPKVTGIAGTESARVVMGAARRQARTGRSRLA